MEHDLTEFIKKLISHFTDKVQHDFIVFENLIELNLYSDEEWTEIDFRALHSICRKETSNFSNCLNLYNFDYHFVISSIPFEKKVKVRWFKNDF